MSLVLNPPPVNTPFDVKGESISVPWLQWVQRFYATYAQIIGSNGAINLESPYAQFYSASTQTVAAATVSTVLFDSTLYSNGISVGSPTSRLVANNAGYYSLQYRLQLSNTAAATDDVTVWVRKNGTDIANSATLIGVPPVHSGINGHEEAVATFVISLAATDYIELCWTTDGGTSSLLAFPASVIAPVHPAAPSAIATLQYIARS